MAVGIAIIVIFVVMAAMMMLRKIPAMLALPVMAILISLVAGLPLTGKEGLFTHVLGDGATKLAGTYVAILFSCWLSQILHRAGVTDTIIKKAAELGGDKPIVVAMLLCAVTVVLFTTLYGTGAVAMVGAVVLPIMMSVGLSAKASANAFLAAMSAGYSLNPANIALITGITGVAAADINTAAIILCLAGCLFTALYLLWHGRKIGKKFAFSAPAESDASEKPVVKGFSGLMACLTPVIVVLITILFRLPALPVFIMGILWAIVFTWSGGWNRSMNRIVQSCYEGFKEGAPTTALMWGIGMILNAVTAPTTQEVIRPFMVAITPTTATGLIIFVCVLAPLGLYRGPFNLQGLGAGLAASMLAVGVVPVAALSAVFYAAFRWPSQSCPTSTQVVWSSNFVGLDPVATSNEVQLPNWILTVATVILLTQMYF